MHHAAGTIEEFVDKEAVLDMPKLLESKWRTVNLASPPRLDALHRSDLNTPQSLDASCGAIGKILC